VLRLCEIETDLVGLIVAYKLVFVWLSSQMVPRLYAEKVTPNDFAPSDLRPKTSISNPNPTLTLTLTLVLILIFGVKLFRKIVFGLKVFGVKT